MVRLPKECISIVGLRAHIYKTGHDGQPAFLVVPYTQESAQLMAESKSKVSKLGLETEPESRISALESQIAEIKSLIFQGGSEADADSKKGAPESGFEPESEHSTGLHDRPLHYPGLRTQSDCLTQHSLLAKYR